MIERFSASVAARHIACHASADLESAIPYFEFPEVDSTAAATAGTNKHAMLEPIWALSPKEMAGIAKTIEYVANLRKGRRFNVMIEQSMEATWLTTKPRTTADLVLYTQDEIHILDTKFGMIPVPVVDNQQLLYYAACYGALAPKAKGVSLHILQPAADNFDSWFADTATIAKFMAEAQAAEAAIQAGSKQFGPSDHCKFCAANPHGRGAKGKPFCPEMMQLLYPSRGVDEDEILGL